MTFTNSNIKEVMLIMMVFFYEIQGAKWYDFKTLTQELTYSE